MRCPRQGSQSHKSARGRHRGRRAISLRQAIVWTVILALCLLTGGGTVRAGEVSKAQMQSLDEQVQEIKSDVLRIAAELNRLEECLKVSFTKAIMIAFPT